MSGARAADLPEPDRVAGAPHPREAPRVIGQAAAEAEFLDAARSGRLHHGWLLTGPRGVGKATLAWAIARYLLARDAGAAAEGALEGAAGQGLFGAGPAPARRLEVPEADAGARLVRGGAHPGLFVLRRGPNAQGSALSSVIRVEEVRRLRDFFGLSAPGGGRRVVIVDAADEMNPNAANALLKLLEEPPARAVLLLISHQPSALLPTIRSRCRVLRLAPLGPQDMAEALAQAGIEAPGDPQALAELSGGSVGEAVRLLGQDGPARYAELVALLEGLPRLDRQAALRLAEAAGARGAEDRFDLLIGLFDLLLARLARTGAQGAPPAVQAAPGEAEVLARLSPGPAAARGWAELGQQAGARLRHGRAVNLDPAALILDTVFRIRDRARG